MPRAKRAWSVLRAEFYEIVGEDSAGFWTAARALVLANSCLDLRYAEMNAEDEDWFTDSFGVSLVAGQISYSIPSGVNAFGVVRRAVPDGASFIYRPMSRDEGWHDPTIVSGPGVGSITDYMPTYRFDNDSIIFSYPPSFAQSNGVLIEMHPFPARLAADSDTLPDGVPDILEALLVWDLAYAALAVEGSTGDASARGEGFTVHILAMRSQLEAAFRKTIGKRIEGPTRSRPVRRGG